MEVDGFSDPNTRDQASGLGIVPLRLPLVFQVTIDPVLPILALLAFAPLLLFFSLFSPVAHYNSLLS